MKTLDDIKLEIRNKFPSMNVIENGLADLIVDHLNDQGLLTAWQPIETAPKDELICVLIESQEWGPSEIWLYCYYDNICKEWRTSRPSGHLRCVPELYVTHWMPLPKLPEVK